jgi:restriction system protein
MPNDILLLVSLLLFAIIFYFLLKRPGRHKRNIKKARKIIKKLKSIEHSGAKIKYLRKIDPFVFEELLLESFKNNNYKIKRNKRYTGDGGIDGRVIKDNKLYLVQAKRYSSSINPKHIEEFSIAINNHKAHGGFFIHTGRAGNKSCANLLGHNIKIFFGEQLLKLIS